MNFDRWRRRFRPLVYALTSGILLSPAPGILRAAEPAREEPDEITTDRPDFTEATDTLRPGLWQFEGGLQTSSHALPSGPVRAVGGPSALLRIGLTRRSEVRLGADGYESESHVSNGMIERLSGHSDLDLMIKIRLLDEHGALPAIVVIPGISVPSGSPAFTSGGHDRFLKLCWSHGLGKGFDAAGNINFRWEAGEAESVLESGYSLTVSHRMPARLEGFWEIYRLSPIEGDEAAHWIADTGVSHNLGRNVHLDLAIGHTMMAHTPSWIFTVGFAVRGAFPTWGRR